MLTRILARPTFRFSSIVPTTRKAAVEQFLSVNKIEIDEDTISALNARVQEEESHLSQTISDLKRELRSYVELNFSESKDGKTPVLTTQSNNNTWKLAELITLASAGKLSMLLLGFPSYISLAGTLGVFGAGAALSYSNFLKRTSPQITSISLTQDNNLHIEYEKSSSLWSSEQLDFVVDPKNFCYASFSNHYINWLRKCKDTQWVRIEDQLYWFNGNQDDLKVNSHLYHKLL